MKTEYVALIGAGIWGIALFTFAMSLSWWHERQARKRRAP